MTGIRLLCIVGLAAVHRADDCQDVCLTFSGACGANGSYCKNDHACHDLFWYRSSSFCNHSLSDCSATQVVTCAQATRLKDQFLSLNPRYLGQIFHVFSGSAARDTAALRDAGLGGFHNLGNTCYLGATLQLLTHSRHLRELMATVEGVRYDWRMSADVKVGNELLSWLSLIFRDQWGPPVLERSINPWVVLDVLSRIRGYGFEVGTMEDSQDTLRTMLGYLSDALPPKTIENLFSITVRRTRTCSGCGESRDTEVKVQDLLVPVPRGTGAVPLSQSLHAYLNPETVEEVQCENGERGQSCGKLQSAVFHSTIVSLPEVLLITLMRFSVDGIKIDTSLVFDTELNFSLIEGYPAGYRYQLVSVVHHHGTTADSGHYVADFLRDGTWFHANDEQVAPIDKPTTSGPSPFVLLFERIHEAV